MATRRVQKSKLSLDNPDFIPFALHDLGGAGQFVDVEDVFLRAYELAPDRFGWRKHALPNYKTIYKALRDLEEREPGLLLKTRDGRGRQLSARGVEWVQAREPVFRRIAGKPSSNPATRRPGQRLLNELAEHPAFAAFRSGHREHLPKHVVADVLICSPDSPPAQFRERLETYRAAARDANREEILEFLTYLDVTYSDWFGGSK